MLGYFWIHHSRRHQLAGSAGAEAQHLLRIRFPGNEFGRRHGRQKVSREMSEKLTPYEWVAGDHPEAKAWRQSLIARWESGGAAVFQRVFRQAQTQEPGALFRQPATKIVAPAPHVYFDVEQAPKPTGAYFDVPGMEGNRGGHRKPPATPKPAPRHGAHVAEMTPAPLIVTGQFREIVGAGPIVWEGE